MTSSPQTDAMQALLRSFFGKAAEQPETYSSDQPDFVRPESQTDLAAWAKGHLPITKRSRTAYEAIRQLLLGYRFSRPWLSVTAR